MASKWVPVRDAILDTLQVDKVTDEMKADLTQWLLVEILPAAKKAASDFCSQVKEQAASESGWCKVRDMVVLPFLIQGGVWLIERTLEKTTGTTEG